MILNEVSRAVAANLQLLLRQFRAQWYSFFLYVCTVPMHTLSRSSIGMNDKGARTICRSKRLIGTCNVLGADSAVASPGDEKGLRSQRDEHLERFVIAG